MVWLWALMAAAEVTAEVTAEPGRGLYPAVPVRLPGPGAPWIMGQERGPVEERPAHPVWFDHDLLVGRAEVTQGLYAALTGARPSTFQGCGEDCPVESVSWYEAVAFADRLSAAEGLAPCGISLDCAGWRLPTEAEWEYVAQGQIRRDSGWYAENSGGAPHPVCTAERLLSPFGLCDTAGNVYEWVHDRYERFAYLGRAGGAEDPHYDAFDAYYRTRRGGSWADPMDQARPTRRLMLDPAARYSHVGFRLVRSVSREGAGRAGQAEAGAARPAG